MIVLQWKNMSNNKYLFNSALAFGLVQLGYARYARCAANKEGQNDLHFTIMCMMLIGLTTSLLNHGTSNIFFRRLDRLVMWFFFMFDNFFLWQLRSIECEGPSEIKNHHFTDYDMAHFFIIASGLSYLCAKQFDVILFHIAAHALLCTGHLYFINGLNGAAFRNGLIMAAP